MNIDVLMHAALRRLGTITIEWVRGSATFRATASDPQGQWFVEAPTWAELWEQFILEAVARR